MARRRLLRRAAFLLVAGYLFVLIWPADILHYYAFYIGIGAFLLAASDRALWLWALLAAALFSGLATFAGYWDQLDPIDLSYEGFWTPVGLVRNLLFNGWHPVMPWIGFYLVGMWLGRRDVRVAATRWRIIGVAALVAAAAEVVAAFNPIEFDIVVKGPSSLGLVAGNRALLAADPLPPGPVFLAAAGGTAVVLILLCVGAGAAVAQCPAAPLGGPDRGTGAHDLLRTRADRHGGAGGDGPSRCADPVVRPRRSGGVHRRFRWLCGALAPPVPAGSRGVADETGRLMTRCLSGAAGPAGQARPAFAQGPRVGFR